MRPHPKVGPEFHHLLYFTIPSKEEKEKLYEYDRAKKKSEKVVHVSPNLARANCELTPQPAPPTVDLPLTVAEITAGQSRFNLSSVNVIMRGRGAR